MSPKLFLVVNLWVRNFFLGYFVGLKVFHVDISWVGMCFLWVFRGFESFLVGASYICIFFLVSISWVQGFSRGYFVGPQFFLLGFRGSKSFLVDIWLASFVINPRTFRGRVGRRRH